MDLDTTRASLLIRIRDRADTRAWTEFDKIYRPIVYRFARGQGLDDAAAEDVVQHCFFAINQHVSSFEYDPAKGRFRGWLMRVAGNRIRNMRRDARELQAETRDFKRAEPEAESPEQLFERVWEEEHLKHCLQLIRTDVAGATFDVFQSYVIEETPLEKVCADHDMTANQVYQIKWRVLRRLRERMKELSDGAD